MAKNLKLQIKNTQLAEVLKQNKQKDEKAKETEATSPAIKKATEEVQSKVLSKARPARSSMLEQENPGYRPKAKSAPSNVLEKQTKEEPPAILAHAPEAPPVKEERSLPTAPVEQVVVSPPPIQVAQVPKEVKKTVAAAPVAAAETEEEKNRKEKLVPKKVEVSPREEKVVKDVKSVKKQAFQKAFDSRDRHGLRANDEESWRRKRHSKGKFKKQINPEDRPKTLSVRTPISLKDLASHMKIKVTEIIEKLFKQGLTVTINDLLDDTSIVLIGDEFGCKITIDRSQEARLRVTEENVAEEIASTDPSLLVARAPVVAFMGHVDHGKTSLIDAIRKSKLAAAEAGAITQHIGAFRCHTKHGDITILDTPGHEAFSAIRSRGAEVTDIIVIVIAGDEGIMPQTDEAIKQAQDANVPIIVAVNKADKPGFNPDNVLRQLSDRNILAEAWGGETITVNCSATTGQGIEELLEMLALQSEILELLANPSARARGTVLESEIQKGMGNVATLLIQNGTLKRGDAILFEHEYGRVKTMKDERGRHLTKALPSIAVEVTGISGSPAAGCEFIVVKSEKEARKLAEERLAGQKREHLRKPQSTNLEAFFLEHVEKKEIKVLPVILKADVKGSLEAIETMLLKIPSNKARVNIISSGIGTISESDVEWANASNAVILGFHTKMEPSAEEYAKRQGIKVFMHEVIYHLIDEVKDEMTKLLDKVRQENEVGTAEVRMIFKSSSHGAIAGCQITDGVFKRTHIAKVFRNGNKIWEGDIASLKRHQDDVKEVLKGFECGILLSGFKDLQAGDLIRSYEVTYLKQTL